MDVLNSRWYAISVKAKNGKRDELSSLSSANCTTGVENTLKTFFLIQLVLRSFKDTKNTFLCVVMKCHNAN